MEIEGWVWRSRGRRVLALVAALIVPDFTRERWKPCVRNEFFSSPPRSQIGPRRLPVSHWLRVPLFSAAKDTLSLSLSSAREIAAIESPDTSSRPKPKNFFRLDLPIFFNFILFCKFIQMSKFDDRIVQIFFLLYTNWKYL